jgi:hypothetical protein
MNLFRAVVSRVIGKFPDRKVYAKSNDGRVFNLGTTVQLKLGQVVYIFGRKNGNNRGSPRTWIRAAAAQRYKWKTRGLKKPPVP